MHMDMANRCKYLLKLAQCRTGSEVVPSLSAKLGATGPGSGRV